MSKSLPPQFENLIRREVAAGNCDSETLNTLRSGLQPSLDELDAGKGTAVLRAELREFLESIAAGSSGRN